MTQIPGYQPERITRGLGLPRRIATMAAGIAGAAMAVVIAMTWLTEPIPLPIHTRIAFAAIILIGLFWTGNAVFALARRPLFAIDRVVAAALALVGSTLMTAGLIVLATARTNPVPVVAAAGLGTAIVITSTILLWRAIAAHAALHRARRQLQANITHATD